MVTQVSDEYLLKLWRDPTFNGSYRGARTFQILLKTDLNIDVPLQRLYKVLGQDQIFLIHQRSIKKFERRHYVVHNYGELVQMDIAVMYEDPKSKDRYFLLLVDVFSSKVFTEPLKSRDINDVLRAFQTILSNFKSTIYEVQADQESAFLSKKFQNYCKEKKIIFRPKFGKNKAAIGKSYFYFNIRSFNLLQPCSYLARQFFSPHSRPFWH